MEEWTEEYEKLIYDIKKKREEIRRNRMVEDIRSSQGIDVVAMLENILVRELQEQIENDKKKYY